MKTLKLNFCDFWPNFCKTNNYFYNLLSRQYEIVISDTPDFLIYSCFGREFQCYKCTRIFYTGENIRPNFADCDYAFTFDFIDQPNHYRLPLYALYIDPRELIKPENLDIDFILRNKTKFCSFVVSNPDNRARNDFFFRLSKYKLVDSGGKLFNNLGGPVRDKRKFMKSYKFSIAFENVSHPGYTTEKIVEPMLLNTIPIYWGNKLITRDFNSRSFLNYHEFKNVDTLIERIIQLDNDDNLFKEYLRQPYYYNNEINQFIKPENVLKQFEYIFNKDIFPVAQKYRKRSTFFSNLYKLHLRTSSYSIGSEAEQLPQGDILKLSENKEIENKTKTDLVIAQPSPPLVSVITPSYNQGRFIEETILSVRNQTYTTIEHIVIDGGSNDGTLEILRKYSDCITWISEPDDGQSNAINKGWRMSKGGILAYLNSDDTYMPWAVEAAVRFLTENPDVGMVYGDADLVNMYGEVTQHHKVGEFDLKRMLCSDNHVPQPTVFFRREVLNQVGYLDENLHLAMDLDYWIRISLKFKIRHIPQTLATMRFHPKAKIPSQYYKAVYEHIQILDRVYSNCEFDRHIKSFRRQAYSAVHLRGSIDYYSAGYRGKAWQHLMKALSFYPQNFIGLNTLVHLFRLSFGRKATNFIIRLARKRDAGAKMDRMS